MSSSLSSPKLDLHANRLAMEQGLLYYANTPDLVARRAECGKACNAYNSQYFGASRRQQLILLKQIITTLPPLPPPLNNLQLEEDQLASFPIIEPPFRVDYGWNVHFGSGVFINFGCVMIDTCTHPTSPSLRNGLKGPEFGSPIEIGEDCWLAGSVTVLPGVSICDGSTVGAASVVTKNVAPRTVVVGNPAKWIRSADDEEAAQEQVKSVPGSMSSGRDSTSDQSGSGRKETRLSEELSEASPPVERLKGKKSWLMNSGPKR